jgi:hypothetical protein
MPIATQPFELPVSLEPGHSYTVHADQKNLDFSRALGENAPSGSRWDLDAYEPIYNSGMPVGIVTISVLRNIDRQVLSETSVPLYSGQMKCGPPFCEAE